MNKKTKRRKRAPRRPRVFERSDWKKIEGEILMYVQNVYYVEEAMRAAGVSPAWWYKWQAAADAELDAAKIRMDQAGGDEIMDFVNKKAMIYVKFVESVRNAQAMRIVLNAREIHKRDPLEYNARVQPSNWGKKDRHVLAGDPDFPLETKQHVVIYLPDNGRGPDAAEPTPPDKKGK